MGGTVHHQQSSVIPDPWNVFGGGIPKADLRFTPPAKVPAIPGGPVRSGPAGRKPIGEILLGAGVISAETRDRVLDHQEWKKVSFGTALLETGGLSEHLFLRALSVQYSVPGASAADLESIPHEILGLVKNRIAERQSVIPFRKAGRTLHLAMSRPHDGATIRAISLLTGFTVVPHVAIAFRVALAIEKHYGVPAASYCRDLARTIGERAVAATAVAPALRRAPALPTPLPPAPTPPPLPWRQLTGDLCEVRNQDQVALALRDFLKDAAGPAAFFRVLGDDAVLWKARPVPAQAHSLSIPIPQSPLFASLRDAEGAFAGPCPDNRVNRQILASVGGHLPGSIVVVPVNLSGRTALYVVVQPDAGKAPLDVASLRRLAKIAATALGLVALHHRLRAV